MHEDAQAAADHFKSDKQTPSDTVKHKILIHKNKNNIFLSEQTIIKYRFDHSQTNSRLSTLTS